MIGLAGIAIWCVSFMGLSCLLYKLIRVDAAFVPMITASAVIVILMLTGMIGQLKIGLLCVYGAGFAGAGYTIMRRERIGKKGILVIGICAGWLFYLIIKMRNQMLVFSDDFGHWGLVARFLIATDSFPDAGMELMHFPSYPLGSACFIYYVSRFAENSDRMYLIAQAFLLFVYALPLLAFVKRSLISGVVCCICVFMMVSSAGTFIDRLQVDTLIPFMGFAAAALAFAERKNIRRVLWVLTPVLMAISFMKISGLFFASACMPILGFAGRKKNRRTAAAFICFAPLIAFLSYYLFQVYADMRFPMTNESVHALNLKVYAERAAERLHMTIPIIKAYISRMIRASLIEKALCVFSFFVPLAFMVISILKKDRDGRKRSGALLMYQMAVYVLYNIMMIAMYLFSMTVEEANQLASFTRYYRSLLIFIALIAASECIKCVYYDDSDFMRRWKMPQVTAGMCVLIVSMAVVINSNVRSFFKPPQSYGYYEKCRDLTEGIGTDQSGRYTVFVNLAEDAAPIQEIPLNMMLLYELDTMDVVCIVRDEAAMEYRIYDRRYETEKAGGVFYLLNSVPYERKNYSEFDGEITRYIKPGDTVLMLSQAEDFISLITDNAIENVLILQ